MVMVGFSLPEDKDRQLDEVLEKLNAFFNTTYYEFGNTSNALTHKCMCGGDCEAICVGRCAGQCVGTCSNASLKVDCVILF